MNIEALGRYHAARQKKEAAQRKLSAYANTIRDAALAMECYNPAVLQRDRLPDAIAQMKALMADIELAQETVVHAIAEMRSLRDQYNLGDNP